MYAGSEWPGVLVLGTNQSVGGIKRPGRILTQQEARAATHRLTRIAQERTNRTCSRAALGGAQEADLLEDEADADEGAGGDGEREALGVVRHLRHHPPIHQRPEG